MAWEFGFAARDGLRCSIQGRRAHDPRHYESGQTKDSRRCYFCRGHSVQRHVRVVMDGNCQSDRFDRDLGSNAWTRRQEKKNKPKRSLNRLHTHGGTSNWAKVEGAASYLNASRVTRRESVGDELTCYTSKG